MLESVRNLQQVVPNAPFFDERLLRSIGPDESLEVAFLGPLDDDEHLVVLDETLDVSDDVLVLQLFK